MQLTTYEHHSQPKVAVLKTKNQNAVCRRDNIKRRTIHEAVREWELRLPGQAQERIARLVAGKWTDIGGRDIVANKQNLWLYLKNETNSDKYTAYVIQLASAIVETMPLEIARCYGFRTGMTETELVASTIKEFNDAH